jgi:hypothetical protein
MWRLDRDEIELTEWRSAVEHQVRSAHLFDVYPHDAPVISEIKITNALEEFGRTVLAVA